MRKILKDRGFVLSVLLTFIFFGTGITFLFAGLVEYSVALFVLLPIILGSSIGIMPSKKNVLFGAVITTILILAGMYIPGLSGLLCIVMALPIIIPLIFLGYTLARLAKRHKKIKETDKLPVL